MRSRRPVGKRTDGGLAKLRPWHAILGNLNLAGARVGGKLSSWGLEPVGGRAGAVGR